MSFHNEARLAEAGAETIRYVHHISIGVDRMLIPPYKIDDAAKAITNRITVETCGVTCFRAQGTWLNPDRTEEDCSPRIERNDAINFIITLDESEVYLTWRAIKQIIREEVQKHKLGCRYIHAMMWPAEARIFEVKSASAEDPA